RADAGAFAGAANDVRLEVTGGGTLLTDIAGGGSILNTGPDGAIRVSGGGTFITDSPTFTVSAGQTVGGQSGTLFGFAGGATSSTTALTLHGTLALDGTLGASIAAGSTGTIHLDAGQTLKLLAGADLAQAALHFGG